MTAGQCLPRVTLSTITETECQDTSCDSDVMWRHLNSVKLFSLL